MKTSIEIKKLPTTVWYQGVHTNWAGKSEETIEQIVKQGFATIYPAYSYGRKKTYKKTKPSYIPLHRINAVE